VVSLYRRHMYEHHMPSITTSLTEACGEGALQLFVELLRQAGVRIHPRPAGPSH
jgi:hypothetical protein